MDWEILKKLWPLAFMLLLALRKRKSRGRVASPTTADAARKPRRRDDVPFVRDYEPIEPR
jgi:hypothetical protein